MTLAMLVAVLATGLFAGAALFVTLVEHPARREAGPDVAVREFGPSAVIPFTLLVIMPTNQRLLDARLDARSDEADQLLSRWGRLHAVRTVVGVFVAFAAMSLRA